MLLPCGYIPCSFLLHYARPCGSNPCSFFLFMESANYHILLLNTAPVLILFFHFKTKQDEQEPDTEN
jgi:hypothetical protein